MEEDEDRRLAARCLAGDGRAWALLQARYGRLVRRAAGTRLALPDAEEVVQRVMTRLSTGGALASYDGRSRLGTWLAAVTLREALNYIRGESRARDLALRSPAEAPDGPPTPLQDLLRDEDAGRLRSAMEALPGRERLLLRLIYWEEASYREAARLLGVAEGSISPLLARARAVLEERLS